MQPWKKSLGLWLHDPNYHTVSTVCVRKDVRVGGCVESRCPGDRALWPLWNLIFKCKWWESTPQFNQNHHPLPHLAKWPSEVVNITQMFVTNFYFESLTERNILLLPTWLWSLAWGNWCLGSVEHHSIKLRDTNQAALFNQLASWTNTEQHIVKKCVNWPITCHTLSQATWSCHAYETAW